MTLVPLIFILLFTTEDSIILLCLNNSMTEPKIIVIHVTEVLQKNDLCGHDAQMIERCAEARLFRVTQVALF